MLVYVCSYIKYNNNCSTVRKLNVSKNDSQFDQVRKYNKKTKSNVATLEYFLLLLTCTEVSFQKFVLLFYIYSEKLNITNSLSNIFVKLLKEHGI